MNTKNMSTQHFIILGTARTGSNLLISLLSGLEEIRVLGELFNLDTLSVPVLKEILNTPVDYLQKRLYQNLSASKRMLGFKIFYDHFTPDYFRKMINPEEANEELKKRFQSLKSYIDTHYTPESLEDRFRELWDHLASDKELKVIHLKRNNKLETLVSLKTAFVTNQWMSWKPAATTTTHLELDVEECNRYFNKIEAYEASYAQLFAGHDILELSYETMIEGQEATLRTVCDFLGIAAKPASTILKKQVTAPMTEVISNYTSLKQAFHQTKWAAYFNA